MVLKLGRARRSELVIESHTVNLFSFQLFSPAAAFFAALLLISAAFATSACDGGSASPAGIGSIAGRRGPAGPVTPAESASGLFGGVGGFNLDAGEIEAKVDPPAPAGDLRAEIGRFTTIDACVEERASVDPVLGDALEAIGYDTFLRDACRVIDATKANDANRCAAIDASSLEARCRATVAEVNGKPEACPWEAARRRARGRDAKCVAVASRDPRLCAAVADLRDRATCEATLGLQRSCAKLRARTEQARCARDAERWRGVVSADSSGSTGAAPADKQPFVVAGTLHVEGAAGTNAANASTPVDVDLTPDLARGVTIVEQRDGAQIVLGPLTEAGLDFIAPSPHTRASLALELFLPVLPTLAKPSAHAAQGAGTSARIERAELLLPGRLPLSTPGARSTLVASLVASVDGLALSRASPVKIEVNGDLGSAGSNWHVHAEATTFVRDIVKASDLYDGMLPSRGAAALGEDAGMR